MSVLETLSNAGIPTWLARTSSLDRYLRLRNTATKFLDIEGTLVDVARLFESVEYPGIPGIDAIVRDGDSVAYIRCLDGPPSRNDERVDAFTLRYDTQRERYFDPASVYRSIRSGSIEITPSDRAPVELVCDAALLTGRYRFEVAGADQLKLADDARSLAVAEQQIFLSLLLTGRTPASGLELLRSSGFLERYWSLLAPMDSTDHSKEFHPEGNVWKHTMETFRYRKTRDLTVALALLLHDCGKPYADSEGEHRFKNHADIGAEYARRFLISVGYDSDLIHDVAWLIRYHMIPGALDTLPRYRTREIMRSPLFPQLLELYRCDLSSTYRGPDGYYRACRIYRSFLKHEANPFRDAEGKKVVQRYVE